MAKRARKADATEQEPDTAPDTGYHTPVWPPYVPPRGKEPHRTLAILRPDQLVTEHGEKLAIEESWARFADLLFEHDLLVFSGPLLEALAPYLECIAAETKGTRHDRPHNQWCEWTLSPHAGQLVSLVVHRHPKSRKIVHSRSWGGRLAEPALLTDLRWLLDACAVGDHATPAALGAATMYQHWRRPAEGEPKRDLSRHHRPTLACVDAMQQHAIGSRKESYSPLATFDAAWEHDRTNGYAAEVHRLPCGTTRTLPNIAGSTQYLHPSSPKRVQCATWWGQCLVRIGPGGLPPNDIAPFAVRGDDGELTWPTGPGTYETWLWREEAEEIVRLHDEEGRDIHLDAIGQAWWWDGWSEQLAPWALEMDALRTIAKSRIGMNSPARADLVKGSIVGAIGRLGMDYTETKVIPEEEAQEGDVPLTGEDVPDTGLYVRTTQVDAGYPKHWHAYILAMMNLNVYKEIRAEYQRSGAWPIAVNTDGIIYPQEPAAGVLPEVAALGEYKNKFLGWTAAPAPGVLVSEAKITTPGMTKQERGRIMRYGEGGSNRPDQHYEGERERNRRQARGVMLAQLERLRQGYLRAREYG